MYDLTNFTLKDMTNCGAMLRKLGADASSMDEVANRTIRYLYDQLIDPQSGERACVLVRFFKTHPYSELDLEFRESVQEIVGHVPEDPAMRCLTLLASAGVKSEWNDRRLSVGHKVCPLAGFELTGQYPMFSQLIKQFGLDLDAVVKPDPALLMDLAQQKFSVFHVAEAAASPYIPAQTNFVIPFGIQSVLGFGGMLPTGNLFAIILFSKVPIPRETAEYFKTLALNVKMALLPFEDGAVFDEPSRVGSVSDHILLAGDGNNCDVVRLRSQVANLEQLLAVHERVMLEQSVRIEQTAESLQLEATRADALVRVAARLNAHLELEAVLNAVCEETIQALNAPAAMVLMCDETRTELHYAACYGLPQEFCDHYKPVSRSIYDNSAQQQGPIIIVPDMQTRPHLPNADLFVEHKIRTMVLTSLIRETELIGALNIYSFDTPRSFTPDELSLLQGVADQAAQAIENAQFHANTQRRLIEIESLQRVTSALLQSRTPKEIFDVICTETQTLTGADTATLFLLQDETWLQTFYTKGNFRAQYDLVPVNDSFSGLAVRQKRPMFTNNFPNNPHAFLSRSDLQTLLVHPLIVKDVVIGSLNAINKPNGFDNNDVRILGLLAAQAAIAIENARLHEQAEESAILAERHRLARELHDSVTQSIYSIILFADASRLAIEAERAAVAADNIREARAMAGTAIADMRLLLYELHPPELAAEGLVSALHTRLDAVESRAGLKVDLNVSGEVDLPLALESELYKIAQEALNNVVKHANASVVTVQIDSTHDRFCLTIQDDGAGFAPDDATPNSGLGLRSINERVQQIDGELSIQSRPGEGTIVQIVV